MELGRPYYYCPKCGASQIPWDDELGLSRRTFTPGAEQVVTMSAVQESFGQVAERSLRRLTGLQISEWPAPCIRPMMNRFRNSMPRGVIN
jgi:hypothetical protein